MMTNKTTIDTGYQSALTRLYDEFLEKHSYESMSADELLMEVDSEEHKVWLREFCEMWEYDSELEIYIRRGYMI